jgi:pimeloyl-ACP methyl ester carboxylesterase
MSLFTRETGARASPAVIFLHGSPLSGRMWLPQLERLSEFHCLAPDLPGHGQSAAMPLVMPAMVQELAKLIRRSTPNGKAHIVGLSFGGVVAQALMVAAPEVVDHVILSGTGTRMSKVLVWMSMLNEPILRFLRPEQLAALVCLQFGIPSQFRAAMGDDFKAFSSKTLVRVMQTYLDIEMPAAARSPTLVAVGQKETLYAKSAARALSRGIPGAKGVMVPGCGHVWNLEAPDLFAETVRSWVADKPLPDQLMRLK